MGCDIHMFTEVLKTVDDKQVWVNVDDYRPNPYFGIDSDEREFEHQDLHGGRNYSLFTLLAGVRDYSGKNPCISEPKGLPEDCSKLTAKAASDWEGDAHTHSWLTLAEIEAFQEKEPVMVYSGLISPSQAKELDEFGITPDSWCQGTSDKTWVHREWKEKSVQLVPLIRKMRERLKDVMWLFNNDYDKELDNKIRIVFWFDN